MTGFDTPHQERRVGTGMTMKTCTIEGCSMNVHPFCHIDWLCEHCYYPPPPGNHVCRHHSKCYRRWVLFKAGKIPHSENGCIPGSAAATRLINNLRFCKDTLIAIHDFALILHICTDIVCHQYFRLRDDNIVILVGGVHDNGNN
jgi:hypothetical protein